MRILWLMSLLLCVFSAPVEAVRRNSDGHGEVLIVPYYSVRTGRTTLLAIANQRGQAKAVKVRVRESHFGKLLMQFNLYLAPHDRWSATLFEHGGRMVMGTSDQSCTVPDLIGDANAPRVGGLAYWPASDQDFTGDRADAAGTDLTRTHEGSIEVFEMGEVLPGGYGSANALAFSGPDQAQPMPNDCARLNQAFSVGNGDAGYWSVDPTRDLGPAQGGLSAEASVVYVSAGFSLEIPVVGLTEFRTPTAPLLHTPPTASSPDLDDAVSDITSGEAHAFVKDELGQEVQLRYPSAQAIDAVSAVLTMPGLHAAYSKARAIGAWNDWILAQPTRRFYGYTAPFTAETRRAQFASLRWLGKQGGPGFDQGVPSCEFNDECPFGSVDWWDIAIPVMTFNRSLDTVVGAVTYGHRTAFLGTEGTNPAPDEGSLLMAFGWLDRAAGGVRYFALRPDLNGRRLAGLPVIAFAAMSYETAFANSGRHALFADTRLLPAYGPVFVNAGGSP
ncbi:hypothetical protein [Ahniella affigens]|nr:hypothetical protein [Ahniella affigens]